MKIGIMGGSFSPIHKSHIGVANELVKANVVDIVLVMPCYKSLYNKGLVSGEHRLNMIDLSVREPHVQAFGWEIKNKIEGLGTYDIMKMLEKDINESCIGLKNDNGKMVLEYSKNLGCQPQIPHDIYFIMGLDNSQKVRTWKNGDKILDETKFIVVPRLGVDVKDTWYLQSPHIFFDSYKPTDFSSTEAKKLLGSEGNTDNLLDPLVKDYIIKHNLYKDTL